MSGWNSWGILCWGFVTAEYLFQHFPDLPEGDLTKTRAALVCEKALCGFSSGLGVGDCLRLSHGEHNSGGRTRPSILADAFEAIIAAIYLDGGMEEAKKFILRVLAPNLKNARVKPFKDYKTALQEIIQQNPEETFGICAHRGKAGPDHNKHFTVEVHLNTNVIGKGGGPQQKRSGTAGRARSPGADGILKKGNIALFIPHAGCPHQCSFCNQKQITGVQAGRSLRRTFAAR